MRCHEELPIAKAEAGVSEDDVEVDVEVDVAALQPNSDGFMFLRVCLWIVTLSYPVQRATE